MDWGYAVGEAFKKGAEGIHNFLANRFNEEAAKIVEYHAAGSTAASLAAMFPGAGPVVAVAAQTALIYSMYVRINRALGISLSKNKLKSIAAAAVSNIASNASAALLGTATATVLSFIPGIGSGVSTLIMAAVGYASVVIAALTYAGILDRIGTHDGDNMSEDQLRELVNENMNSRDLNSEMKELMADYRRRRKDGSISGNEHVPTED